MESQLVVQLPISESTNFDSLIEIENGLIDVLKKHPGVSVVGHDIGEGRFNVFIRSDEPWPSILGQIRAFLEFRDVLEAAVVAARPVGGESYQVIWPSDYRGAFEL